MHSSDDVAGVGDGDGAAQENQDRYIDVTWVFDRVLNEDDFPEGDIERLEITLLASGEATWRVWAARADEAIGGYYGPDVFS